jgi:TatD DNase family protein
VIDTHCHLDHCDPPDAELVERARAAGLNRIATVGLDGASIERGLQTAARHEEVFAIVGRHPHETAGFGAADLDEIERAAADPKALAIGETGLDHLRDYAPREDQRRAFDAQIEIARRLDKALVIHVRDGAETTAGEALEDTFEVLRSRAEGVTVILHCFSAPPDRVNEAAKHGWYCSFAGNLTYPASDGLRAAAGIVPEELLLVETDAPFLAPQPHRGRPNQPAHVVDTAARLAAVRGLDYPQLDELVERNAARALGW